MRHAPFQSVFKTIQEVSYDASSFIPAFRNVMHLDEPGRTCLLIASFNTLDRSSYIPRIGSNTACMSTRMTRLSDDPHTDHIALGLSSLLLQNHTIPYLLHATSKFKIPTYFQISRRCPTKTEGIPETVASPPVLLFSKLNKTFLDTLTRKIFY